MCDISPNFLDKSSVVAARQWQIGTSECIENIGAKDCWGAKGEFSIKGLGIVFLPYSTHS